ncbi:extracellular matrix protein 2-like, partial [Lampetra planeri]
MSQLPIIHNQEATKLDIAENNISILAPDVFSGLPNLDTLDLSKNKLGDESLSQNLLSNLTMMKKLNLDSNQFTTIPTLPPSLEELRINTNQLTSLTPRCFKGVMKLVKLEVEDNILYEGNVSPLAFRPLQRLMDLQLANNRFRSIPQGLPPSLQVLGMKQNQIVELTGDELRGCKHLKVLDLSHNLLHEQSIAQHAWTHL